MHLFFFNVMENYISDNPQARTSLLYADVSARLPENRFTVVTEPFANYLQTLCRN